MKSQPAPPQNLALDALIVSSFNRRLYEASGHKLVQSHKETSQVFPLLICHEEDAIPPHQSDLLLHNLETDPFLISWLENNRDSIPIEFGGDYQGENPWNRRAFQWFRKVAALQHAFERYPKANYILWLDCDCIFRKPLLIEFLEPLFGKHSLLYLKGERDMFENGFIGFNRKQQGDAIFEIFRDRYLNRTYRNDPHWDDCHQLEIALEEAGIEKGRDISTCNAFFNGVDNNPFPKSELGDYLEHWKGLHGRVLGITPPPQ